MGHFKLTFYRVAAVLLFLGITAVGFSQNNPSFQKISGGNDFQGEYQISQDTLGNIWMASKNRVVKYNSATQEAYTISKGLPSQVTSIGSLFIDSVGSIWLGTNLGLCRYNFSEDIFELTNGTVGNITNITEDTDKNVWVASTTSIWRISPTSGKNQYKAEREAPLNSGVNCLVAVNNSILMGTENGLYKLNLSGGELQKIPIVSYRVFKVKNIIFNGTTYLIATAENGFFKANLDFTSVEKLYNLSTKFPVTKMVLTADRHIYISTAGGGILYLNKNFELVKNLKNPPEIYDLHKGKNNILWIAAKSGVEIANISAGDLPILTHDPAKYSSLGNNNVTAIAKDDNGRIWFGTQKGLSIWNPQNDGWQHILNLSYRHESTTPDIIKDMASSGTHMWVATYNDGVYKINISTFLRAQYAPDINPKISTLKTTSLFIDANKNVWIGGDGGSLSKITPDDKSEILNLQNVHNLTGLPNGNVLATSEGNVYKINIGSSSIKEIPQLSATELKYSIVNSVVASRDHIVLATNGGIFLFDPARNSIKVLNEKSGLPSNDVKSVFTDSKKELWAATMGGITNIQIREKDTILKNFGTAEGLKIHDFNPNALTQIGNGEFALGTNSGVQLLRPEILKSQIPVPPHLVFMRLKSGNKILTNNTLSSLKSIDLDEDQKAFDVEFLGVAPSNPENVEYTWKLDGLEDSWAAPVRKNRIQYANLMPGNYTLMVKARTKNGGWSPVKKLTFMVAAPWYSGYQTYILISLAALLIIGVSLMVFRRFRKNTSAPKSPEVPDAFAYEIKAPLNILLASLNKQILEEDSTNKEKLKNTLEKFNALFEPVLNIDEPVRKRFSGSEISKIDLQVYIKELIEDFKPLLKEKELEIIANNQWENEAFYYNLDNLNRILVNLISSSLKYCDDDGKIIINLFETHKGDLKIQISDNGKGIPQEQQKIINQYFKKGKLSGDLQKKDIFTLLLVKDIVKRSGGSIVFESVLNEGTTYGLILKNRSREYIPKSGQKAKENVIPIAVKPAEVKEFGESKILIVEDNTEIRRVLMENIGRKCQVIEAADTAEALRMTASVFPDIIVTEKDLSDTSAFDLCDTLQSDISLNHIGILMIVPSLDEVNYVDKKEKGILDFIEKPINVNVILLKISNILNQQKELRSRYVSSGNVDEEVIFRNENDERFIGELKKIVFQHLHENGFGVHELSTAIGMNSNALYMKLKNLIELAPEDFIIHTKLSYARRLLVKGEVNINEVANRSGFVSAESFLAAFKKFYGYSPGGVLEDNI